LVCPVQLIVAAMTDELAVTELKSVRKLPAPHLKVVPALVDSKSPYIKDAAVTATWGAQPWQPVVAVAAAVGVGTSGLPELVDDCCSSTVSEAAPQTITATLSPTP